jgi:hypothetical protein
MWKIPKPRISALHCFETCIAGIRDIDLKNRMRAACGAISLAESEFDHAAINTNLHLISPSVLVGEVVTAQEMTSVYDHRMARNNSRGRNIYDQLMIAAKGDICPFCGQRNVSTLDHYLTKSQHPALAVTPINLIPSCKDCNHEKNSRCVSSKQDQLLNAYFDDVEDDLWLHAEIICSSPAGVVFSVQPNVNWDAVMGERVRNHFGTLKLGKLYASQAGRQLLNMRWALAEIFNAAGSEAVREDLVLRHRSCTQIQINSWQAALYAACAESDWYCNGGFRA